MRPLSSSPAQVTSATSTLPGSSMRPFGVSSEPTAADHLALRRAVAVVGAVRRDPDVGRAAARSSRFRETGLELRRRMLGWQFCQLADLHAAAVGEGGAVFGQRDRVLEAGGLNDRVATELRTCAGVADGGALEYGLAGVDDALADRLEEP